MAGALVGAVSCERCGREFERSEQYCSRCGVLIVPAAVGGILGTYSGMLNGVDRASRGRRNGAFAIDAAPIVAIVIVGILLGASDLVTSWVAVVLAVAVAVAYLAGELVALSRRGSSLGRALLYLRTVDDLTGDPIGAGRVLRQLFTGRFGRRTVTGDLRTGRDPLALAQPPLSPNVLVAVDESQFETDSTSATRSSRAWDTSVPADSVAIVIDTGERLQFSGSLLVGRAPENRASERDGEDPMPLFAWPDLSRTISKTHALLEWSATVLWVTDLHSSNGSVVISPEGDRQPLAPGIRGAATVGWTVQLGDRSFEVRPASLEAGVA